MFWLSLKSKYGLAALFQLALHHQSGPVQIKDLAEAESIPQNYLEQVLIDLKRAGLVRSFRGVKGGYQLARQSDQISVLDILTCLEGPSQIGSKICNSAVLGSFWADLESQLEAILHISLSELVLKQKSIHNIVTYSI